MQHLHPTKAMQPQHKAPPDHGVKYAGGASCLLPRRGAPQLRQPRRVPAVAGSCPTQAASRPTRRRQAAVAGQPHAGRRQVCMLTLCSQVLSSCPLYNSLFSRLSPKTSELRAGVTSW